MTTTIEIWVTPLTELDLADLRTFHQRCSPATLADRYLTARGGRPPISTLAHTLTSRYGTTYGARLARSHRIIALGQLIRTGHRRVARAAVIVEDEFQGAGIGPRLLDYLIAEARREGYSRLDAAAFAGNQRIARMLQNVGAVTSGTGPLLEAIIPVPTRPPDSPEPAPPPPAPSTNRGDHR